MNIDGENILRWITQFWSVYAWTFYYDAKNLLALKKTDLSVLQADKEEFTASWSSTLGEARSKEEEKRIQLVQASVKLRRDMRNVEVRAPVDGIVLDLPKVSSGSIVKQGENIATLVRVNQPLTLEVDISPKDVTLGVFQINSGFA